MKNFPNDKYKYFVGPNKVIAVSTYAGRKVRGVAKCAPEDTFDVEKGKELAAARCALKIAEKRLKRATVKLNEADQIMGEARAHLMDIGRYYNDSYTACEAAKAKLEYLENSF